VLPGLSRDSSFIQGDIRIDISESTRDFATVMVKDFLYDSILGRHVLDETIIDTKSGDVHLPRLHYREELSEKLLFPGIASVKESAETEESLDSILDELTKLFRPSDH